MSHYFSLSLSVFFSSFWFFYLHWSIVGSLVFCYENVSARESANTTAQWIQSKYHTAIITRRKKETSFLWLMTTTTASSAVAATVWCVGCIVRGHRLGFPSHIVLTAFVYLCLHLCAWVFVFFLLSSFAYFFWCADFTTRTATGQHTTIITATTRELRIKKKIKKLKNRVLTRKRNYAWLLNDGGK